jgi:Carboxypeptidase regulatory-like domain
VCGPTLPDESIVVDAAGHLANVVVTVAGLKSPAPAEVAVTNDRCRFAPRVSLLRPKGVIRMTSHDPVLHTMHASVEGAKVLFNVSVLPNITLSKPIDRPGVVQIACGTHTWMRGYLHVTDELSAVSGADGSFKLENVPAGSYALRFWHETLGPKQVSVTVTDGQTATVTVTMAK